jgi:hypothetical protein
MKKSYEIEHFNQKRFMVDASDSLKSKVYANQHKNGILDVYYNPALTEAEVAELDSLVENHDGTPNVPLRVHRVLPDGTDPLISDFTILGFRKESPSYERGRKTRALYKCVDKDEVIVEKVFSDVIEDGVLTGIKVNFRWYDEENNVGLEKTEVVRRFNKYEAETEQRKRRERQIDYLVAGAKGTPIEDHISKVFDMLYSEVILYKEQGVAEPMGKALDKIKYTPTALPGSEAEETNNLWAVLNQVPLQRGDDPSKVIYVIQSIKYQIGLMTLEEIDAANG